MLCLFKNTLLMATGIVFYFGFKREAKPLRQRAMVANFSIPANRSPAHMAEEKKAHTFLPSLDNANSRPCQKRLLRARNFATMAT